MNLGGLQITRIEDPNWSGIYIADNSTWRTSMAFGSTFDPCPDIMPAGFYAGTLTVGSTTQLFWPATNPAQFRFAVNMPDPKKSAVVRLVVQVRVSMQRWLEGQHHHSSARHPLAGLGMQQSAIVKLHVRSRAASQ